MTTEAPETTEPSLESIAGAEAQPEMPSQDRMRRIAEAAYYLAEHRGFAPGGEMEDWLAAERQVEGEIDAAEEDD